MNTIAFMCIWYDEDSFTQIKRSNAHEVNVFMSSFSEAADANITGSLSTLLYE